MTDLDTIRIYEGLGELRFGATRTQVTDLLGPKYEQERLEEGDVELYYPDLGLTFTFWADDGMSLGFIDTERPAALLRDKKVVGMEKGELEQFIRDTLGAEISEEGSHPLNDGRVQGWIDVDEYALMFWLLDDKVYRVSWSSTWQE